MIVALNVHYSRLGIVVVPDHMQTSPRCTWRVIDGCATWCNRLVAPPGRLRISARGLVNDSGLPDPVLLEARRVPVEQLPEEALVFLLGSRYCETEKLTETARRLFATGATGWARVRDLRFRPPAHPVRVRAR